MIKMEIDEFIFEVKEEILSYEDLGEKKANEWEENFKKWLDDDKKKKKNVKASGNQKYYVIQDESEIFDIVDEYCDAVEQNKEKEYWNEFQ